MKRAIVGLLVSAIALGTYVGMHRERFLQLSPDAAAATATAVTKAPILLGLPGLLFAHARNLHLDKKHPDLTVLEADSRAKLDPTRSQSTFAGFRLNLARQVREGKLDTGRLEQDIAAFQREDLALRARQTDAIRRLHDMLGPGERLELADAFRQNSGTFDPGVDSSAMEATARERNERQLKDFASTLGLSDEQKERVRPVLVRRNGAAEEVVGEQIRIDDAAKRQMDALLARFVGDEFRVDDSPLAPVRDEAMSMKKQVDFVNSVLPVLTAPQMGKFADMLEAGAHAVEPAAGRHTP
jgi:hypothetical protein